MSRLLLKSSPQAIDAELGLVACATDALPSGVVGAVEGAAREMRVRALTDGHEDVQVVEELGGGVVAGGLALSACGEDEAGILQQPLADRRGAREEGGAESGDVSSGQSEGGDGGAEAEALVLVGARQREQVPQGRVSADGAGANVVLDGLGQLSDQGDAAGNPALGAIEATTELLLGEAEAADHFPEEPPLLDGAVRLAGAKEALEDKGLCLAERLLGGERGVLAEAG